MTLLHFPAPPLALPDGQYHPRPARKPKHMEVTPYGLDVRIVGSSSIPHPRSPSPLPGCCSFPFQIMHNSHKRHNATTHAPPRLSEKTELKEVISNILIQEEKNCARTISGRQALINVNDSTDATTCTSSDVEKAHREMIIQCSPSPAFPEPKSNPDTDTPHQTRNVRAAPVNMNKITLASTPSDCVRFEYPGRRTVHATTKALIGSKSKSNRISALSSSCSCSPTRPVLPIGPSYSRSSVSYSKSKDPMPSPQTTSPRLHYEPREGPVLTIPSLPSTHTPPALLQRSLQEQQALVAMARSEKRHKHLSMSSIACAKSGEFTPPQRRWEAENKIETRRNSLEQDSEREMIKRTTSTETQAQAQHTPTLMVPIPEVNPRSNPPQIQTERKKPRKLLRRPRSSPSISRVAANTERPPSFPVMENNTIRFPQSHRASKSWGGTGKEGLDTAVATLRVERREDRDAPNFVMMADVPARRSFSARQDPKSMPVAMECGQRKERGWSGAWNREDMDEVVRVLRNLKAE